jgi:hypothetical protein
MKKLLFTTVSLCLVGCATTPSPERQALLSEFQNTIPTCEKDVDCDVKWDAAQLWVVHHAAYKIQTSTNVLIETYNAVNSADTGFMVQVTKEPLGGGKYQILVNIHCANMFGCVPNQLPAMVDFNRTVNSVTP